MTGKEKLINDGVLEEGIEDEPIESQINHLKQTSCPCDYGLISEITEGNPCDSCDECWDDALNTKYKE